MLSHQATYLWFCRIGSQKSKIKADSSGFGNKRYRITIQLFAYLRLSPLDTPVRAECDGREKALQANLLEEGDKKYVCLFLSSKQKKGVNKLLCQAFVNLTLQCPSELLSSRFSAVVLCNIMLPIHSVSTGPANCERTSPELALVGHYVACSFLRTN